MPTEWIFNALLIIVLAVVGWWVNKIERRLETLEIYNVKANGFLARIAKRLDPEHANDHE